MEDKILLLKSFYVSCSIFVNVSYICESQNKVFYRVAKLLLLLQGDQVIGQVLLQVY